MLRHPVYLLYGVLLLAAVGAAEYRGWSWSTIHQVKDVPKTVRDNPGSYRSPYAYYPRYFGGK
jgi:hypothetical protein